MPKSTDNKDSALRLQTAYAEHKSVLVAYLSRWILKSEDVDDILQTTFLQTLEASKKRTIESPKAYLFIVARNLVFKKLRKKSNDILREIREVDEQYIVSNDASPDANIHGKLKLASFSAAVMQLPKQCRKVFLMRKLLGLSHAEISKQLGISPSTVERHITNAIQRCRSGMQKEGYLSSTEKMVQVPRHK